MKDLIMATIQNTTSSQRHLTAFRVTNQEDGNGQITEAIIPGRRRDPDNQDVWIEDGIRQVDDNLLAAAKKNPVVSAWFEDGELREISNRTAKHAEVRDTQPDTSISKAFADLKKTDEEAPNASALAKKMSPIVPRS